MKRKGMLSMLFFFFNMNIRKINHTGRHVSAPESKLYLYSTAIVKIGENYA